MKVDFFIVGAPKAGTTSLYKYLNQHQDVVMSSVKEPNYFSKEELESQDLYYASKNITDEKDYHSLFQANGEKKKLGEASVSYLFYPKVSKRIFTYNKDAKIIIILRNPVDRAYSHYKMDFRLGFVKRDFEDLVLNNNQEGSLFYQQYIDLGLYHLQVKSYIDEFGSTNVCVMFYEDLKKDRATFVNNIFSFLNLKSDSNINFNLKYNKSKLPSNNFMRYLYSISLVRKTASFLFNERLINFINKNFFRESNQEIESKVRHKLNQVFLNDIFMLEKLLNKDLSSWKK
ncbi:sulfotransferase domain-containing protein [Flavobacteriales bacterium]|nr:sulfotransferase domain-containing protein [Flavobacteriales bacterium]|tara:strand:- start:1346 stop:2206 length:861 start_codon:yes stop_codon:yes gene_type:complete